MHLSDPNLLSIGNTVSLLAQDGEAAAAAATGIGLIICFGLYILFMVAMIGMWIWMLVDCISNEPSEGNDKMVWILVIVFAGALGAIIYYFARRPKRKLMYGR